MTKSYAVIRECIEDVNNIPLTYPQISALDFQRLKFLYIQVDSADGDNINEKDHPEGYNLLLLHPQTHRIHWAYSHAFDFVDEEPMNKYRVTATSSIHSGMYVYANCFQEAYTEALKYYDRSKIIGITKQEK